MCLDECLLFSAHVTDPLPTQNHEALVDRIQAMPDGQSSYNLADRSYSATLFITPTLAHWFEPSHPFLKLAVDKIWAKVAVQPELECAVVDALPDPRLPAMLNGQNPLPGLPWSEMGHEGACLRISNPFEKNFKSHGQFLSTATGSDQQSGMIHFDFRAEQSFGIRDASLTATNVILPAANTLFVNGRSSIMFYTSWAKADDGTPTHTLKTRRNVKQLHVHQGSLFRPHGGFTFPHVQLTPARRIVSSMGNVLKQVQADAGLPLIPAFMGSTLVHRPGEPFSASMELEALVPMLHGRLQREDSSQDTAPQVFAVIIPARLQDVCIPRYYSMDRQLSEGASLHKVTGGGGGWGSRQGMLSLEPAIDFRLSTPSIPQFDISNLETGTRAEKDELLAPGNLIIFYATHPSFTRDRRIPSESLQALGGKIYKQTTLGVTTGINTITPPAYNHDDSSDISLIHEEQQQQQPPPSPLPPSNQVQSQSQSQIIRVEGFFGMLSEGGMALEKRKSVGTRNRLDAEAVQAPEQASQEQVSETQPQEQQQSAQQQSEQQVENGQEQHGQQQQVQRRNNRWNPVVRRICTTRLDVPGFRFNFVALPTSVEGVERARRNPRSTTEPVQNTDKPMRSRNEGRTRTGSTTESLSILF